MTAVRTRFAPSPTGYIHVGNVRSALYPFFVARQASGKFILRIEDTDQSRFVDGAEAMILDVLSWLGIDWDEGPLPSGVESGDYGPYHQTERREIYRTWAQKLVDAGLAYADDRSAEELAQLKQNHADNHQLFLYRDNRPASPPVWDGSQPLRFKVVDPQDYSWHDEVMGDLHAGRDAVDDFIIMKSDGLPTYNFAHIVDDAEMGITHVIRGQEYISSMPKYLALYDAFGIKRPVFAHLPHIMAPSGNKKLGKRDGAKSVTDYRAAGYLPEAMVNFLACLGWNDGTEQEIFSLDELITKFNLGRVQQSGARFDEKRLLWMNGQWIRRVEFDKLFEYAAPFWGDELADVNELEKREVLAIIRDRLKTLADIPVLANSFFVRPEVDWSVINTNKPLAKIGVDGIQERLRKSYDALAAMDYSSMDAIQSTLNKLLEDLDDKPTTLFGSIRIALTWAPFSPGLPETMVKLGRDEVMARIDCALDQSS